MRYNKLMLFELLRWWYGPGWRAAMGRIGTRTKNIGESFSVGQLLETLFEPWRRIVSYGDRTLEGKLRAAGDNLISRFIGFLVRLCVLITAGVLTLVVFVGGIVETVVWPVLPLGMVYCLARSFV